MLAIIVCTVGSKSLSVLRSSVETYAPDFHLKVYSGAATTFGEAYNAAMEEAFCTYDEIIIANDDVVLTPSTLTMLLEDVRYIKENVHSKIGFVATLSDYIRYPQNIKNPSNEAASIKTATVISPVFAWISKEAFEDARFPPLNWYSDDVMCEDLNQKGYTHYISRAYVHHAGSQTVGEDYNKLNNDALPWLRENRPEYVAKWF
jgi:GT2 family glycosyltransferase